MNYEEMSLTELKEYAKSIGLSVGNIGKEKLIVKIKEKENLYYLSANLCTYFHLVKFHIKPDVRFYIKTFRVITFKEDSD